MIGLRLTGFSDSVYTRAVRLALHEKDLPYEFSEVNPFTEEGLSALDGHHPFGRVPVLQHYAFEVYETTAILGYLDDGFDAPRLTPKGAKAAARMRQVMGIVDSYVYWPLVRQVFSHGYYRLFMGDSSNAGIVSEGLAASDLALDALEDIAAGGLILNGRDITQADCMLLPMIDCFACVDAARAKLNDRPALTHWHRAVTTRPAALATRPAYLTVEQGPDA